MAVCQPRHSQTKGVVVALPLPEYFPSGCNGSAFIKPPFTEHWGAVWSERVRWVCGFTVRPAQAGAGSFPPGFSAGQGDLQQAAAAAASKQHVVPKHQQMRILLTPCSFSRGFLIMSR